MSKEWKVTKFEMKTPKAKIIKMRNIKAETPQQIVEQMKKINKEDLRKYDVDFGEYDLEVLCTTKDTSLIMTLPQYLLELL